MLNNSLNMSSVFSIPLKTLLPISNRLKAYKFAAFIVCQLC